jgi:hypothetical protein
MWDFLLQFLGSQFGTFPKQIYYKECINKEKARFKHFLPRRFEWFCFVFEIIEEKVDKNFNKNLQLPDVSYKN